MLMSCTTGPENPVFSTFRHVIPLAEPVKPPFHPDPRFEYLRLVTGGRTLYLARGNWEDHHRVSVWYSASGEVLRFRDGRLVGATGLFIEWRAVRLPTLPSWDELANQSIPYTWQRERDVMPGYRYGVVDHLTLQRVAPPTRSDLTGIPATSLIWFKETDGGAIPLPPAWYAWDPRSKEVLYGLVCLDATLCFSWQHWPVT